MALTSKAVADWYSVPLEELGWDDRPLRREGLRYLLIDIYEYLLAQRGTLPAEQWEFLWQSNVWASTEALTTWHKRLPTRLADTDRARVAAMLAGNRNVNPAVVRWVRRRQ